MSRAPCCKGCRDNRKAFQEGRSLGQTVRYLIVAAVAALFALSLYHASWIAPDPVGGPKLIAGKPASLSTGADGCIAEPPSARMWDSEYGSQQPAELRQLLLTAGNSADALVIESEMQDGQLVLARDMKAGCAADAAKPAADAKAAFAALAKPEQFIRVTAGAQAAAAISAAPTSDMRQIYFGDTPADIAAIKIAPAFAIETARQCAGEYRQVGMWGSIPESCRGGTMLLTLGDLGIGLWGWPDRFLARMAQNNIRVIIAADVTRRRITGLTELSQYSDIASSYNGYIWIDDIEQLGPALRP